MPPTAPPSEPWLSSTEMSAAAGYFNDSSNRAAEIDRVSKTPARQSVIAVVGSSGSAFDRASREP
jgi:hypothetical protein